MTFYDEALPYAVRAHEQTGVLLSVVLAQWDDETGGGGPDWSVYHNPGNVGSFDNQPIKGYATLTAGVNAYVQNMNAPDYAPVRKASGWRSQCTALGASPWATGHYNDGNGPGSSLVSIIESNQLWRYDDMDIALATYGGSNHVFVAHTDSNGNAVVDHWWQAEGGPDTTWHHEVLPG